MGRSTGIAWTDATFNPWRGCTKVSPGCANCYAETLSHRNPAVLGVWGDDGTRVIGSDSYWRQPLAWNREAKKAGVRRRVFCASLADVFEDREDLVAPRRRLWALILETPWLDWLLLTKRPENMDRMAVQIEPGRAAWPRNVWLGTTVEDQRRADERIPHLLRARAAVRFLSVEPMLGPVDLTGYGDPWWLGGLRDGCDERGRPLESTEPKIHWVIVGGESGHGARQFDLTAARAVLAQCRAARVPFFMKQLGSNPVLEPGPISWPAQDPKGGDQEEWPDDLRVQEFPTPRTA